VPRDQRAVRPTNAMIITIDGPAGTGKSSVAQVVADWLGFDFLDTGAMYRTIAFESLRRNANLSDQRELAFVARHCRIDFDWSKKPPGVNLNDEPVGRHLRSGEVTRATSIVAAVAAIREQMVGEQQRIGREHGQLVTEGRDQGSVVFPQAPFKFYLDATPAERARRRAAQLRHRGEIIDQNEILRDIVERDKRDASRAVGPLAVPMGAIVIDTTHLTQEQVVEKLVAIVRGGQRQ